MKEKIFESLNISKRFNQWVKLRGKKLNLKESNMQTFFTADPAAGLQSGFLLQFEVSRTLLIKVLLN